MSLGTPEERQKVFDRARALMEQMDAVLHGAGSEEIWVALQLLLSKVAVTCEVDPLDLQKTLSLNLPNMMLMWRNAEADVETGVNTLHPTTRGKV